MNLYFSCIASFKHTAEFSSDPEEPVSTQIGGFGDSHVSEESNHQIVLDTSPIGPVLEPWPTASHLLK